MTRVSRGRQAITKPCFSCTRLAKSCKNARNVANTHTSFEFRNSLTSPVLSGREVKVKIPCGEFTKWYNDERLYTKQLTI